MAAILSQFTPISTATVAQIQANLIAYFQLFAGLPGITYTEGDVTWIASGAGAPGNHVLRAQIADDRVDQRIDETLRQIGERANQVDWYVFPSCQPPDLGERLAARGAAGGPEGAWMLVGKLGGPGGNWLLADLNNLPNPPAVSDQFHVAMVTNQTMLHDWVRLSLTGFGHSLPLPEWPEENAFYAAYTRHGFGPEAYSLRYIGYRGDRPVTTGTLLLAGGIAGLFDISTPAAFRRHGFGSAISWAMVQEAKKRGYQQAYVWSSNMGKGVYQGVGFVPIELGMREYQWQKR